MKDLSRETVKKINEGHIRPKAKWKFSVENSLVWVALALLVMLGAAAFSLAYYFLSQLDWDVLGYMSQAQLKMSLGLMPYFWFLLLACFLILAFILFRHTKEGYRFGGLAVVSLMALLLLAGGLAAHYFRADEDINDLFTRKVPGYQLVANNKERQWSQPEAGLLGGEITQIQDNGFRLRDFQGEGWQINYDQNTLVKPSVQLQPEEKIKVIGEKTEDKKFHAREIRPWEGKGMMRGKMGGKRNGKQ
jgi:hypothetical protein